MYYEVPGKEISSGKVQVKKGDVGCLKNKKAQPGLEQRGSDLDQEQQVQRKDGCSGVIHVGPCDLAARKETRQRATSSKTEGAQILRGKMSSPSGRDFGENLGRA